MNRFRPLPMAFVVIAAALAVCVPARVQALHASGRDDPGSLQASGAGLDVTLGASIGLVEGQARELVFDYPGGKKYKLSELTWDLRDVVLAGVRGSVVAGRRLRLNLGVWTALSEGSGMMIDRDWNYPPEVCAVLEPTDGNWTDESRHPDTSLDHGLVVDVNVSVLALQSGPVSLRGIVGYKHDTWQWSARGGTAVYSWDGFRDTELTFADGETVITYEQRYSLPYVGLGVSWAQPAFQVASHLLVGPVASADDTDDHVLKGVRYEGDCAGGTYVGLGLNASLTLTPHWYAAFDLEYQSISESTGDVTVTGAEGYGHFESGGGVAMNAMSISLGAGYRF